MMSKPNIKKNSSVYMHERKKNPEKYPVPPALVNSMQHFHELHARRQCHHFTKIYFFGEIPSITSLNK